MTLRTLNYGNYSIFLIMGNAGFCPSAVSHGFQLRHRVAEVTAQSCVVATVAIG